MGISTYNGQEVLTLRSLMGGHHLGINNFKNKYAPLS
jgi:hypothetical protein